MVQPRFSASEEVVEASNVKGAWESTAGYAHRLVEGNQTMIDVTTKKPLILPTDGTGNASFELPLSQLGEVQRLLDGNNIRYWVMDEVISFNGGPEMAMIVLSRNADPNAVQAILDGIQ